MRSGGNRPRPKGNVRGRAGWVLCRALLSAAFLASAVGGWASDDLKTLLDEARRAVESRPPVIFDAECFTYKQLDNGNFPERPTARVSMELRRKGDSLDVIATTYRRGAKGGWEPAFDTRQIWDGKRFLHRQQGWYKGDRVDPDAYVAYAVSIGKRLLFDQSTGAFLEGRFGHNNVDGTEWIDVVRNATRAEMAPEPERVDGFACRRIVADAPSGHYTLWIDPLNGYGIRKATVRLAGDGMAWGKPLSAMLRSFPAGKGMPPLSYTYVALEIDVSGVAVEKIGGRFFPVAGVMTQKLIRSDGHIDGAKKVVKRTNVRFAPDFKALGAFQMDLREGTVVRDVEHRVSYRWTKGDLIPRVDEHVAKDVARSGGQLPAARPDATTPRDREPSSGVTNATAGAVAPPAPPLGDGLAENPGRIWLLVGMAVAVCLVIGAAGVVLHRMRK